MGSLIWLSKSFYVFVALLIKVLLPYVAVVTVRVFRWPLVINEVSKLSEVEENINQRNRYALDHVHILGQV